MSSCKRCGQCCRLGGPVLHKDDLSLLDRLDAPAKETVPFGMVQRPKFGFSKSEINSLLDWFEACGRSVLAEPLEDVFVDEADKKFYEVAKFCGAVLVTGNLKHFPEDPLVMSVADFLEKRRS